MYMVCPLVSSLKIPQFGASQFAQTAVAFPTGPGGPGAPLRRQMRWQRFRLPMGARHKGQVT